MLSLLSSTLEGGGHLTIDRRQMRHNDSVLSPRAALSTIDESGDTLNATSDIELTGGDELDDVGVCVFVCMFV